MKHSQLNTHVKIATLSRGEVEKVFSNVFNLFSFLEQVWIYTRDRRPSNEVLKRAYKSLKILGLNGWKLKKADQSCKEANTIGTMSIRRNFELDGHRGAGGRSGHRISKKSGLVGGGGRSAAPEDYDYYENNYRHQHHQPPPQPISTAELTSEMLGSGLKLGNKIYSLSLCIHSTATQKSSQFGK